MALRLPATAKLNINIPHNNNNNNNNMVYYLRRRLAIGEAEMEMGQWVAILNILYLVYFTAHFVLS